MYELILGKKKTWNNAEKSLKILNLKFEKTDHVIEIVWKGLIFNFYVPLCKRSFGCIIDWP